MDYLYLPITRRRFGHQRALSKSTKIVWIFKKGYQTFSNSQIAQGKTIPDKDEQKTLTNKAKLEKAEEQQERSKPKEEALPVTRQIIKQIKMVSTSNWLSAIPLAEHGFNLSKVEFRNALALF